MVASPSGHAFFRAISHYLKPLVSIPLPHAYTPVLTAVTPGACTLYPYSGVARGGLGCSSTPLAVILTYMVVGGSQPLCMHTRACGSPLQWTAVPCSINGGQPYVTVPTANPESVHVAPHGEP